MYTFNVQLPEGAKWKKKFKEFFDSCKTKYPEIGYIYNSLNLNGRLINKISTLEAQKDIENMFDNYDWIGNTKKTNKQCNG